MKCRRCNGYVIEDRLPDIPEEPLFRCLNCGDVFDETIPTKKRRWGKDDEELERLLKDTSRRRLPVQPI